MYMSARKHAVHSVPSEIYALLEVTEHVTLIGIKMLEMKV